MTQTEGEQVIEIEENSGVEFPGWSMEPMLNTAVRVNEINM